MKPDKRLSKGKGRIEKNNTRTKNVTDGPTYGPRQLGIELRVVD